MLNIVNGINPLRKEIKIRIFIDPNRISGLSIIFSFFVAYFLSKNIFLLSTIFLFIVLFLDFLDGAVARGNKIESYNGQITDWTADRISEIIIFVPLITIFNFLLILLILNILLNFIVLKKKLFTIPLRHFLLIWLIYMMII